MSASDGKEGKKKMKSSSSSSSSSSSDEKAKRKEKKRKKFKKLKKKTKLKKEMKLEDKKNKKLKQLEERRASLPCRFDAPPSQPLVSAPQLFLELWQSGDSTEDHGPGMQKARLSTQRPLTKEEYEAKQSVIRRVVDPETGCTRYTNLIRGEGEIIEEIVSKERHRDQQATKGDGNSFQKKLGLNR
uniref:ADP-ribosylation factor-like protein 6-interacting protein 4 n=1 Tax=Hucho hucho TaxID=62062 RepID=A0A4W5S1M2_9TELE